ncbi:MAG TPA: sortase [Acidimicrobiales bacterium]|nr:sortase [Acidimicrobiales bacterium]
MIQAVAVTSVAVVLVALVATQVGRPRRASRPVPTSVGAAAAPPTSRDPMSKLVDVLRRRRWARVSLSALSAALLIGAVAVLGYPFYTNVYQSRIQGQLDRQLASPELQQAYKTGQVATGDALTRIKIPSLGVDTVVVSGVTASALRAGAGHYPDTPLPCELGNVAIAGHRTTYGRPFHNLDRMAVGDTIVLETPIGECTYVVEAAPFIVQPDALHVVDPTPHGALTLTTCHPKGSAAQRLIVRARLQGPTAGA